jgi:hydroxymethylpyrimidine/phosphomethylpyrimidine kinase
MNASLAIISGLDPSGGAGFVADVRVAEEHGVRPVGAITALTEQDSSGVRLVEPVAAELLAGQLRTLLSDIEVAAVKIGMLGSEEVAYAVAEALALTRAPVVWDPVLRPTRGRAVLFRGDPQRARAALDPHVAVLTPNAAEAEVLLGRPVHTLDQARGAAVELCGQGQAVLITGGDLAGCEGRVIDVLAEGAKVTELAGERIDTAGEVHGTGCALSTALACGLAGGQTIAAAARAAKGFVAARLRDPVRPGRGLASLV